MGQNPGKIVSFLPYIFYAIINLGPNAAKADNFKTENLILYGVITIICHSKFHVEIMIDEIVKNLLRLKEAFVNSI